LAECRVPIADRFLMQESQLNELRREKWRLNGRPLRTVEEAREFIDSVGFCLLYAQRPAVLLPTFTGAWKGSDENLPTGTTAFAHPEAREAKELMVRLLREKSAFDANVFPDNNFILSAAAFPYFYGVVGDRNVRQKPTAGASPQPAQKQRVLGAPGARSEYSPLAVHAVELIEKKGPISKHRLRELLGGDLSEAALDRALDELWARLRITRVDYKPEEGVFWDVLVRWAPEAVKEGAQVPVAGALTALVSKYLDCVLAVSQEELEQFFSHFVGRARVREAINALQAAREISYVHVNGRVMLQSASFHAAMPPEVEPKEKLETPSARSGRPLFQRRRSLPNRARPAASRSKDSPRDTGTE
jgi:hypothetical protein